LSSLSPEIPSERRRVTDRLSAIAQAVSHVIVAALAITYVCGFVILFLFDNSYGIVDFGLFRSKVIVVGGVFAVMIAVSFVANFRLFGMFNLRTRASDWQDRLAATNIDQPTLAGILPYMIFSQLLLSPLFVPMLNSSFKSGLRTFFGCIAISAIGSLIALYNLKLRKIFRAAPTILLWLLVLCLTVILTRYSSPAFLCLVAWLGLIAVMIFAVLFALAKQETLRTFEWERNLLIAFTLLVGIYALGIFPDIKTQFGGGAPTAVLLRLSKKVPPFVSENVRVNLIDQTESGYYVDPGTKRAVFIRRDLVEGIQY
jgi:hypothetical protein